MLENVSKLGLIEVAIAVSVMFNVCLLQNCKNYRPTFKNLITLEIAQEMRHKIEFLCSKTVGYLHRIIDKKSTFTGTHSIPSMTVDPATILETHESLICQTSHPFIQLRKKSRRRGTLVHLTLAM